MDSLFDQVEIKLQAATTLLEKLRGEVQAIDKARKLSDELNRALGALGVAFSEAKQSHYEEETRWANLPRAATPPPLD